MHTLLRTRNRNLATEDDDDDDEEEAGELGSRPTTAASEFDSRPTTAASNADSGATSPKSLDSELQTESAGNVSPKSDASRPQSKKNKRKKKKKKKAMEVVELTEEEQAERDEKAALTIQRLYRSYKVRWGIKHLIILDLAMDVSTRLVRQRGWREWLRENQVPHASNLLECCVSDSGDLGANFAM